MKRLLMLSSTSLLVTLFPATVGAQTDDDSVTRVFDPVIVTTQKRDQDIQDVPIAVTAFDSDDLDAHRAFRPAKH